MGCFFSGPLQKTGGNQVYPVLVGQNNFNLNENEEESQEPIQKFGSFNEFLHNTENPQIYEWLIHDEIGKGAMSRVYLATNSNTNKRCAVKVYNQARLNQQALDNAEKPIEAVNREINIMYSLHHRYILSISEVIYDDFTNSLIMLLPFASEGTLQSYVEKTKPDEKTIQICFFELAEGLRYAHSKNIVHRDLKPDNLLVFSNTLFKLCDFSVSTQVSGDDEELTDTRGSPAFLSPEECAGKAFYPKPADVWAYGVTLFDCVFGFMPFNLGQAQGKGTLANIILGVAKLIESEELVVPEDRGYSPHLVDLLKQILKKDPSERPTFEQIVQSPWFDGVHDVDKANNEKWQEEEYDFEEEEEEANEQKES